MTKAITIRTDEATLEELERLARTSDRSRNYVANQALKEFIARQSGSGEVEHAATPVAEQLEDFRSEYWREDDTDSFLAHLEADRKRSVEADRTQRLK